jgi:hypothetical protein
MARPAPTAFTATFQLLGDKFEHAWYFNRFRCDPLEGSVLVTTALVSESGGMLAVNGFVLSDNDIKNNKERALKYVAEVAPDVDTDDSGPHSISVPPSRVYPVNHINLARMDDVGETGLFRYSIHTLLTTAKTKGADKTPGAEKVGATPVPCYPVVMFRSDLAVQIALLRELYQV